MFLYDRHDKTLTHKYFEVLQVISKLVFKTNNKNKTYSILGQASKF